MSSDTNIDRLCQEQPWQLEQDTVITTAGNDFEQRVTYDERLLEQIASGERPHTIRIWRNRQCLVSTVKEARQPGFDQACDALNKAGWPVVVRRTGGSCVPHSPGVLNLSLVYPCPRDQLWTQEDSYRLLCAPLQQLLESYALKADTGEVPGSFCDGKFNLQVGNRKLVGTSQRWKGHAASGARTILAHACLLVDIDLVDATQKINQLYRLCDHKQQFDSYACSTLRECVTGATQPFSETFVTQVIERLFDISEKFFSP